MKIPITDKFLLELYETFQETVGFIEDVTPPRSVSQIIYRDWLRLQRSYQRTKARRKFSQFVEYLRQKGYIRVKNLEGVKGVMLTPKGLNKIFYAKCKFGDKKLRKDKQWIMIMFDVPHIKKRIRERLRKGLIALDYKQLQKSVWVCPYDVYPETEEIIRICGAASYVKTFLVKEIA